MAELLCLTHPQECRTWWTSHLNKSCNDWIFEEQALMSGELVFVVRILWWSCTEYTLSCEIWQWIVLILYLFCIALRFPRSSKTESWDHLYNVLLISYGKACRFSKMTSKRSHLSSWDEKQNVADCEYQGNNWLEVQDTLVAWACSELSLQSLTSQSSNSRSTRW